MAHGNREVGEEGELHHLRPAHHVARLGQSFGAAVHDDRVADEELPGLDLSLR